MAKSIYDILADLTTETSTPNGMVSHTLPQELLPTPEEFENEEKLIEWATETGYIHACLQKGVQKFLIDLRAAFKSAKKTEVWTPELGQKNVDSYEWTVTNRPNVGGSKSVNQARYNDCLKMVATLTTTGMSPDQIKETVEPIYGTEIVENVFKAISK